MATSSLSYMNQAIPEVVPLNFGLKYRPAKLGVEYHIKDQPAAHFVHEIPLSFVTRFSDIDDVTDELFEKYSLYLNPRVVSHNQVRRLVERLVKQLTAADSKSPNKENKLVAPSAAVVLEQHKDVVQKFEEPPKPTIMQQHVPTH